MAEEQPSWRTSTLSQLAVASVATYLLASVGLIGWLAWHQGDPTSLEKWLVPLWRAVEVFAVAYFAVRKPGNGTPAPPPVPPPTPGG